MQVEAEVRLQLLDRVVEIAVGLSGGDRVEGADLVPAHDGAVPLDQAVVTVDEVLGVAGVHDVAGEIGLGAGCQPPAAAGCAWCG